MQLQSDHPPCELRVWQNLKSYLRLSTQRRHYLRLIDLVPGQLCVRGRRLKSGILGVSACESKTRLCALVPSAKTSDRHRLITGRNVLYSANAIRPVQMKQQNLSSTNWNGVRESTCWQSGKTKSGRHVSFNTGLLLVHMSTIFHVLNILVWKQLEKSDLPKPFRVL